MFRFHPFIIVMCVIIKLISADEQIIFACTLLRCAVHRHTHEIENRKEKGFCFFITQSQKKKGEKDTIFGTRSLSSSAMLWRPLSLCVNKLFNALFGPFCKCSSININFACKLYQNSYMTVHYGRNFAALMPAMMLLMRIHFNDKPKAYHIRANKSKGKK